MFARLHGKGLYSQLGRAILFAAAPVADDMSSTSTTAAGGVVPATLALLLGAPVSFGAFAPGLARTTWPPPPRTSFDRECAALTVSDPSTTAAGHLVNGSFSLAQPLRANGSAVPATATEDLRRPVSNEASIEFRAVHRRQRAARTGSYWKTLTFTLSTTNP